MDNQELNKNDKILKCGKAKVTMFCSRTGPALQECMIRVLHSHMMEKPKI